MTMLTEDVMILDTHAEVIVWVGQSVDPKEKQNALATGQSQDNKPQGNKSSGATQRASAMAALTSAFNSSSQTKTPIAPRIFTCRGHKDISIAALSRRFYTAEKKHQHLNLVSPRNITKVNTIIRTCFPTKPEPNPGLLANLHEERRTLQVISASPVKNEEPSDIISPMKNEEPSDTIDNSEVSEVADGTSEPNVETNEEDSSTKEADENENSGEEIQSSYTYDQLRSKSDNPVTGIDFKKRESYLSPEEFEEIFKMTKETFYNFPRWKQDQIKKKVDLF
ncbi:gelsolin domain-containing protein [Tanacetum coccineum]